MNKQELYRKAIKKSGNYAEVNILVGEESEKLFGGFVSKDPVVSVDLHNCGITEVGCLYMTLLEVAKSLEEEYPAVCYAAKKTMTIMKD